MLRRTGWRLHVVVTRCLRRTISGGPEEQMLPSLSLSSSSSSESEDGDESDPQTHQAQVLHAYLRNRRARCVARVREQGLVPAVLIDGDKDRRPKDGSTDVFLSVDAKPLVSILKLIGKRDFVSRVFDMNIYRSSQSSEIQESLQVLPRNLNYGAGKTNILNVQFVRASPSQSIKLGVPLEYLGADQCPGLMKGGTLKKLAKYVVYNCKACEVPAKIVVDMTVLEIGDRVQVQDLEVNFDLLDSDRTMPVCEIVKDVHTLKAKARRLKKEVFYKKKALADSESGSQSRSLSDDEVEVDDDHDYAKFQRQRKGAAGQDMAATVRNSAYRVFGSKRKGRASEQKVRSSSGYEMETSDEEDDEEVPARFQSQRGAQSMSAVEKSSANRLISMKKGKASEKRICSSSDDEVDACDEEEDDELSARFQRQQEARIVKNSHSRVVSTKKGKVSEQRQCELTDEEVDVDDDDGDEEVVSTRFQRPTGSRREVFVQESFIEVSRSLKNGKASKRRLSLLSEDESDVSDDEVEAAFARSKKQKDSRKELHTRSSMNKFSGSVKKRKESAQRVCLWSDDVVINGSKSEEPSTGFSRQRGGPKNFCAKNPNSGNVSGSLKKGKPSNRRLFGSPFNKVSKETE